MTILVTGGAGYIGGHMGLALRDAGERFVVLDDMSNGVRHAVPQGVDLIVGSTGDYERVLRVIREHEVDTVLHFAAALITPELYRHPLEYYRVNAANGRALLQAVTDAGVGQFIYSATSAVYGEPKTNPVPESAEIAPTTPYGKSKLVMEHMLNDVSDVTGLRYVALRYFNVAGADPAARYGQSSTRATLLVQIAVQCALGLRDGLEIYGTDYDTPDGTCIRDYLHVTDLIDAHMLALGHLRSGGGNLTLNVGYGRGFSVREIVDTVKRVVGRDFPVHEGPRRRGDAAEVVADATLIARTLGWAPKLDDIEAIVAHAHAWELRMQAKRG
ncbi:MAG TPA: UDP-glucose 4-epimerase GalE [Vicinamibacterales bacterium]|nr:UDP-glucose 4-epimerase GalE [Vicinamibacterales bacterium]